MHPEDQEKTAFTTPDGHYEFVRLPFGLKNGLATYVRFMQIVLAGLTGINCLMFIDARHHHILKR